jgi:site-specific recombinase XerD
MKKKSYLFPALSQFFSVYLPKTRGLSDNTIRSYKHVFRTLFCYIYQTEGILPEKVEFKHLENGTVNAWLNWLCEERGCSANTRNHRQSTLVTFARFALHNNFDDTLGFCSAVESAPRHRVPAREAVVHFSKEEMSLLLRLPNALTKIGRRDKVLLSTLYASGARAQELCDIVIHDIRFGTQTLICLHGKGNKTRTIIIPDTCAALLKSYMQQTGLTAATVNPMQHLFSSQTHEHMSISCVEAIVRKYVTQAKSLRPDLFRGNYSPHSFRHSIAMHMLESGIPLPAIKTFLGHVSISTTLIYAAANFELVKRYLTNLNPYAEQSYATETNDKYNIPEFLN